MRKILKKKRGQVLVVAVTAMFVLFVFAVAVVEFGGYIYEKIHMQNVADSGAMEGGLWYARALNITSLSNKILVAVTGVALIATAASLGTTWPFWQQVLTWYIRVQDFFSGTGDFKGFQAMPAASAAAVVINGVRNSGVVSFPMFNIENFKDKGFMPSFNLKRRTLAEMLEPESLDSRYYYIEENSGNRVDVPSNEVKTNRAGRKYHASDGKFVIKQEFVCAGGEGEMPEKFRKGLEALREAKKKAPLLGNVLDEITKRVPLDVVETNPHTILVLSFKSGIQQKLGTGFFKDRSGNQIIPLVLASSALVRVDGGSMCFLDLNGADYTPHLDHILLPKIELTGGGDSSAVAAGLQRYAGENMGSFEGSAGKMAEFLSKANDFVTNYVILH
jgi:hypothetical protein